MKHGEFEQKEAKVTKGIGNGILADRAPWQARPSPTAAPRPGRMKHGEFEQKEERLQRGIRQGPPPPPQKVGFLAGRAPWEPPVSPTVAPRPGRMKHGEFGEKEAKGAKGNQESDFSGSRSVVGPANEPARRGPGGSNTENLKRRKQR